MMTKEVAQRHHGDTPINYSSTVNLIIEHAKVHKEKDMAKVLEYFRYKTETTLSCAMETGILRNSITYYVKILEKAGLLQVVGKSPDRRTGHNAKHYSSDPKKWIKPRYVELSLFARKEGAHD
ncbi:MAG: hypothetical protein LUC88_05735 [Prevotella sp.]|nr:hypothetical protein [Prevotella sp.]